MLESLFTLRTQNASGIVTAAYLNSPMIANRWTMASHRTNSERKEVSAFRRCIEHSFARTNLLDQSWARLPPMMFQVGAGESIKDESVVAHTNMVRDSGEGVSEIDVIPHTPHAIARLSDWCSEGDQALGRAVEWIKARVNKQQ
jgi:acetyl esterase/lipase